ncbi:uncharacterized protein LOC135466674 [Liolophura sinensis]|uniref:uncharacterized protein LOC135466674 n=1 Tax=Liolophura sinensis TaxID=3198878 RepID=UPI003158D2BB
MDIVSSAKAAFYGSIWPSHGVQRARNSRVTHHVGHSRNINSHNPTLLRLNKLGEVSSDGKSANRAPSKNKMTPKLALTDTSNGKSKILDSISPWISFGTRLISSGSVPSKMGLSDNRTAGGYFKVLEEMFGGHTSGNAKGAINNALIPASFKMFPFSETENNKLPSWMDYSCQQNMTMGSFSKTHVKNLEGDLDSPWNKFYSQWKRWNTASSKPFSDCNTCENTTEKKGQKRLFEEATNCSTGKLTSCFQDLSLHNNIQQQTLLPDASQTMAIQNVKNQKGASNNCQIPTTNGESKSGHQNVDYVQKLYTCTAPSTGPSEDIIVKASPADFHQPSDAFKCNMKGDICQNKCPTFSVSCGTSGQDTPSTLNRIRIGQEKGSGLTSGCTKTSDNNFMPSKHQCRKAKRGRPSAKKRRRRKARQNGSCTFNPVYASDEAGSHNQQVQKKCRFEKEASTAGKISNDEKDCASAKVTKSAMFPVSFILGVNELDEGECASDRAYKVSMVMDGEESAFSEEDTDYDCDNFDIYRCDFLPYDGDLFNPVHFTMSISVSPSTPDSIPQSPPYLDIINATWGVSCDNSTLQSKSPKKVSFAAEDKLTTVHPMIAWSHAYQSARKGPWEQYARDRQRFQRRVQEAESYLSPILDSKHRQMIYERIGNNS